MKVPFRARPPEPQALRRLRALDGGLAAPAAGTPAAGTPAAASAGGKRGDPPVAKAPKVPKEHPHRRRRVLAAVWTSAVVAAAGLLLLLVLPTRAWLTQRNAIASAEHKLAVIQGENAKLEDRLQALQTPEEIEQVARQQYNLAGAGEQVFSVLPAPALTNLPTGWPYSLVNQIVAVRAADAAPATTAPPG